MDHVKIAKEQLLHLVFGFLFVVLIGTFAVGLDIISSMTTHAGASVFTSQVIKLTAHAMLVMDLVLFFVYLVLSSIGLVKGMLK